MPPKEEEKGTGNTNEPEICPKCKDRKVERKEAIIELVQTEINYGNDLQILKEVRDINNLYAYNPLQKSKKSKYISMFILIHTPFPLLLPKLTKTYQHQGNIRLMEEEGFHPGDPYQRGGVGACLRLLKGFKMCVFV